MAYETGNATGALDLLDKVMIFATANGWVRDTTANYQQTTAGTGNPISPYPFWWGSLHRGPVYLSFIVSESTSSSNATSGCEMGVVAATNFTPNDVRPTNSANSSRLPEHTSSDPRGVMSSVPGINHLLVSALNGQIPVYHLFCTAQYIHLVVQVSDGSWRHLSAGELDKNSNYVGGIYLASNKMRNSIVASTTLNSRGSIPFCNRNINNPKHSTLVSAQDTDQVYRWYSAGESGGYRYLMSTGWYNDMGDLPLERSAGITSSRYGSSQALISNSVNDFNLLTSLTPCDFLIHRTNDFYSHVGRPADVRHINIEHYDAEDVMTLGSDEWVIFPVYSKAFDKEVDYRPYSYHVGVAYRKVI